jgi:SAM-dependent MidA family methyltransferase
VTLGARLQKTIESEGPITFARFMEEALYDADEGFYTSPPVGKDLHYVTSPHVSIAFAELLAREIARMREAIGEPFTVVEAGAGDGTLASQVIAMLPGLPWIAIDRSSGARAACEARGVDARASLSGIQPFRGVLLANELLDNVPFHRVRMRNSELREVYVDVGFVEVEGPVSAEALQAMRVAPAEGKDIAVSPEWIAFPHEVARVLQHGWAIVFDMVGGVRGYRAQRLTDDLLSEPGSRDITTGVDFDVVATAARDAGFDVWGPITQRDAMLRLGLREWLEELRAKQVAASSAGDARTAVRLYSERSRAPMLADPSQLGALNVLVFGRGVERPGFC